MRYRQGAMLNSPAFLRASPLLFVLIWSTGWIVAGYSAKYADPLTFLALRYACAAVALGAISAAMGASWPRDPRQIVHMLVVGVLLHAIYLGSVWWALRQGLPAGISGLIAAVQPILTAMLAPVLLSEHISLKRWAGIGFGFVGIALVLSPKFTGLSGPHMTAVAVPMLINIGGMIAVTAGTFYQKKFLAGGDLRTITTWQYVGALLVTLPVAFALEPMRIEWNLTMVVVLAWSVLALSLGAIGLLLMLLRKGEVSRAAALIYLIPPTVAIEAYVLFGEQLSLIQIIGMGLTVVGVALARRA
jgi:drug/metabolite transporter (DMT)-like permease